MLSRTASPLELSAPRTSSAPWIIVVLPPALWLSFLYFGPALTRSQTGVAVWMVLALLAASAVTAWKACARNYDHDTTFTVSVLGIALSISFGISVLALAIS